MQYVYVQSEEALYTVGFFKPPSKDVPGWSWLAESDHDSRESAAARCNYLNGGADPNVELHPMLRALLQDIGGNLDRLAQLFERRTRPF